MNNENEKYRQEVETSTDICSEFLDYATESGLDRHYEALEIVNGLITAAVAICIKTTSALTDEQKDKIRDSGDIHRVVLQVDRLIAQKIANVVVDGFASQN